MKTFKTVLFVVFLFLSANTISAQAGYGGGGYGGRGYGSSGYGGSGYGGGNGYGRSNQMPQNNQPSKPKEIPVEVTVAKIVAYYKKELNLDELQEVVVGNIYTKSLKDQDALMKKEKDDEEKKKWDQSAERNDRIASDRNFK